MRCPNCNNEIKLDGDYCPFCGFNIKHPPLIGSLEKYSQKENKVKEIIGDLKRLFTDDKDGDEIYNLALFYKQIDKLKREFQSLIDNHLNQKDPYDDKEWHDRNARIQWKQQLKAECEKWIEYLNYYEGTKSKIGWLDRPYDHRIICTNTETHKKEDLFFGRTRVVNHKTGETMVYDALDGPLSPLLHASSENEKIDILGTTYITDEHRKILIRNQEVKGVNRVYPNKDEEEAKREADQYLFRVLESMREAGEVSDIYNTMTNQQYEIIKSNFNNSFVLQGCAGCGKTMVLFHRIRYAIINNIGELNPQNLFVLTPSKKFNDFIKPLITDLNLENINVKSILEFYTNIISYLYPNYEITSKNAEMTDYYRLLDCVKKVKYKLKENKFGNEEQLITDLLSLSKNNSDEFNKIIDDLFNIAESTKQIKKYYPNVNLAKLLDKKSIQKLFTSLNKIKPKKEYKKFYIVNNYILNGKPTSPLFAKQITAAQTKQMKSLIKAFNLLHSLFDSKMFNNFLKWEKLIIKFSKKQLAEHADTLIKLHTLNKKLSAIDFDLDWKKNVYSKILLKRMKLDNFCNQLEKIKILPDSDLPIDVVNKYYSDDFQTKIFNLKSIALYPLSKDVDLTKINIFEKLFGFDFNSSIYSDIIKTNKDIKAFKKTNKKICIELDKDSLNDIKNIELWSILPKSTHKPGYIHKCELFALINILMRWAQQSINKDNFDDNSVSFDCSILMIDEAQDLSKAEYRLLDALFKHKCKYNLFGDRQQSLSEYAIHDWKTLSNIIGANKEYKLQVNYRNSFEIASYINKNCNREMEAIGFKRFKVFEKPINDLPILINNDTWKSKVIPLKRKAVICSPKLIDEYKTKYKVISKLFVTPLESKGMEFDCVYVIDKDMTNNEKYISYSRALDKLVVIKE